MPEKLRLQVVDSSRNSPTVSEELDIPSQNHVANTDQLDGGLLKKGQDAVVPKQTSPLEVKGSEESSSQSKTSLQLGEWYIAQVHNEKNIRSWM